MITLRNFKPYKEHELSPLAGASHLETEDGKDWYFHQRRFSPDTLKICFDATGVIRSFAIDVSTLYPWNLSVTELDTKDVPKDLDISGRWSFIDGEVVPTPVDMVVVFTQHLNKLMSDANSRINLLKELKEEGVATKEELEELVKLLAYRNKLRKVDVSGEPNWPTL